MFIWPCTIEIDSVPAPIATVAPSCRMWCDAMAIAWRPDEQKRLTVVAETVSGRPATSAATRATFVPCGPSGTPQPQITSSISEALTWGTCASAPLMACAAITSGRVAFSAPRNDLPSGVRAFATIQASGMRRSP